MAQLDVWQCASSSYPYKLGLDMQLGCGVWVGSYMLTNEEVHAPSLFKVATALSASPTEVWGNYIGG